MNYQDRIVGGGLPSLMGHGDVDSPGAFQFAQKSEPVMRYAVGGDVYGYQAFDDAGQYNAVPMFAAPVVQGSLDLGQRNPQVRPDPVQAPVQTPTAPSGRYERVGSGEDAYDQWIPDQVPEQPYVGKNLDVVSGPFDWSKYGFKGNTSVMGNVGFGTDEQGNTMSSQGVIGSSKEFDDWLASQGYKTTYGIQGDTRTDYLLDKNGNVVDTKQSQVDLGHTGFLDRLAAVMPSLIVGLGTGGLGLGLGSITSGALAGAAAPAIKGFTEGQNLGDALKGVAKGAAMGAVGGTAAQYINPAAAEFGKAIGGGNELLTKLATDAASGAGRGLVGSALAGGKNLGQNVLMGGLGSAASGAANTALGDAAAAAGISPDVLKVLAPTALAALGHKDWQSAGLTSLLGLAAQNASQQQALDQQAYASTTDTGDETDRFSRRYPGQQEPSQQVMGGSPMLSGMSLAAIQPALNALQAAGQLGDVNDIGKMIGWGQEEKDTGAELPYPDTRDTGYEADPDKFVQGLIDQMYERDKGDLEDRQLLKGMGDVFGSGNLEEDYAVDQEGNPRSTYTGKMPFDLSDYIDTHDTGYESDPDKFVKSLIDQMYEQDKGDLEDRQLLKGMGDVFGSGNLEEDYVVDQNGNLRSTYTGEVGSFDDQGQWVPKYVPPAQVTPPTSAAKTPATSPTKTPATPSTPSTPTSSTGGMDVNSLLALLALMDNGQQQAAPVQPLFQANGPKVSDIFKNWMA